MKILIVSAGFPPAYLGGGPIQTLTAMLFSASKRHSQRVVTNNYDLNDVEPLVDHPDRWTSYKGTPTLYVSPGLLAYIGALSKILKQSPDVTYLNSFFDFRMSISLQMVLGFARQVDVAIAPRGEFDPGALIQSTIKKRIYIAVFKILLRIRKSNNFIWHASSQREAANIQNTIGRTARIVIRENDTLLPLTSSIPQRGSDELKVIALSRISPKKGIDVLLRGLNLITDVPLKLDVIGPAEDAEYYKTCITLASKLPDNIKVTFLGSQTHNEILQHLPGYDLMACPTHGENFGHVIAEALSASCPVMCADVTPWTDRLASGGGVVVRSHTPECWATEIHNYATQGRQYWFQRRQFAKATYDDWRSSTPKRHFFDLLEEQLSLTRKPQP